MIQAEKDQKNQNTSSKTGRGRKKLHRTKHRRETAHRIGKREVDDDVNGGKRRSTHTNADQDHLSRFPFGSNWYDYLQKLGVYEGNNSDNLTPKGKKKTIQRSNKNKDVIPSADNRTLHYGENGGHRGEYVLTRAADRRFEHGKNRGHTGGNVRTHYDDRILEPGESTGHVCGDTAPGPLITNAVKVYIKFFSGSNADPTHLGFTLQYQISKCLILLLCFMTALK